MLEVICRSFGGIHSQGTGVGSVSVVIDAEMFQKKADRIELAMTAAEVKDTISKQQQNQPRQ